MGEPAISVVIATYNRSDVLAYAIESVLRQTFTDWELIVVGDACTDDTPEVVARYVEADSRVRFGRHPECEVSFDPHRDIDASSRHAELRIAPVTGVDVGWVLVDLGSSNGTYAEGVRVTETPIQRNTPTSIEFGPGGPRVRLFVGSQEEVEGLPPAPVEERKPSWMIPAIGGGTILVIVIVLALVRC
jgi:cellulose synthase/poly-beta-1,6-N-acetylglucosamine synthase-like glycosyltransferase